MYPNLPKELKTELELYAVKMNCCLGFQRTSDIYIISFCRSEEYDLKAIHYAVCSPISFEEAARLAVKQLTDIYLGDNYQYISNESTSGRIIK